MNDNYLVGLEPFPGDFQEQLPDDVKLFLMAVAVFEEAPYFQKQAKELLEKYAS